VTQVGIFRHLQVPTFGIQIANPRMNSEMLRSSIGNFLRKEADSMLSNDSKTLENSGVNVLVSADHAIACMYGRIDMESSPAVRSRLLALLGAPLVKTVSVDLSAVTHLDSSGIATLIEALKVARARRTELKLEGLQDQLLPPPQSCLGLRGKSGSYQRSREAPHSERMPLSRPCAPILPWSPWSALESTRFGTLGGPTRLLLL
jgi:anti-sigma B factor antagonist